MLNLSKRGEIQSSTLAKAQAIIKLLKDNGEMHLRGIASALRLNPATVYRILNNYLGPFIETREIEVLGFRARLVKLRIGKENTEPKDILKYTELKRRIKQF